jgi:WD40 repeat protein
MNIDKPTQLWQLSFEGDWPTSVAFLGDGRRVAAGNRTGQIFVWQLPENSADVEKKETDTPPDFAPVRRLDGHTNGITHLICIDDGKTLISSSLDHTIRIWDLSASPNGSDEVVLDAKVRERLARGKSGEEKDQILNAPGVKVETATASHVLEGHSGWIKALGVSADGKRLISGDDACLSVVWDRTPPAPPSITGGYKQISSWHGYDRVWVSSAALSPDGKTAFTAEYAGSRSSFDRPAAQAKLWNADDGSLKLDLLKVWTPDVKDENRDDSYGYAQTWGKLMKRGLVCADFSPDGKLLAVGQGGETDTGKVHLVEVESGKIVRTVSGHQYGACDVKFSADGNYVISCGRDTTVRICQVSDGKEVAALGTSRGGQFKDWLHAIAISPDQTAVTAADIAGMVHVWQLAP